MQVHHPARRDGEQVGLENVAVGDDDADVRCEVAQRLHECRIGGSLGLQHGDLVGQRCLLHG